MARQIFRAKFSVNERATRETEVKCKPVRVVREYKYKFVCVCVVRIAGACDHKTIASQHANVGVVRVCLCIGGFESDKFRRKRLSSCFIYFIDGFVYNIIMTILLIFVAHNRFCARTAEGVR